jgi:hypothetical protein
MASLNAAAALTALPDMDVELSVKGLARIPAPKEVRNGLAFVAATVLSVYRG